MFKSGSFTGHFRVVQGALWGPVAQALGALIAGETDAFAEYSPGARALARARALWTEVECVRGEVQLDVAATSAALVLIGHS